MMKVWQENNLIEFGKFRLAKSKKVLLCGGEIIALPLKSIELLCVLAENHGEIVSKQELLEKVWENAFVEDSVLTQNIYTLRKTFQKFGTNDLIKTVPRRGYCLNLEKTEDRNPLFSETSFVDHLETSLEPNFAPPKTPASRKIWWSSGVVIFIIFGIAATCCLTKISLFQVSNTQPGAATIFAPINSIRREPKFQALSQKLNLPRN